MARLEILFRKRDDRMRSATRSTGLSIPIRRKPKSRGLRFAREAVGSLFDMMERHVEPAAQRDEPFDREQLRQNRTAEAIQSRSLINLVNEENQEAWERRQELKRARLLKIKFGIYVESQKQKRLKLRRMRITNLFTQSQAKMLLKNLLSKYPGIQDVSTHTNWVESMIQNHRKTISLIRQGVQVRVENGRAITGEKEQNWIDWSSAHRMKLVSLIHHNQGNLEAAQRTYFKQFSGQAPNEPISLNEYRSQGNVRKAA